jgi:hypothetical protein
MREGFGRADASVRAKHRDRHSEAEHRRPSIRSEEPLRRSRLRGPALTRDLAAAGFSRCPIARTTSRVYFKVWEMGCFAGFLMGREVARRMLPRGRGTILLTGATASVRGSAGFSAFSGAKHFTNRP